MCGSSNSLIAATPEMQSFAWSKLRYLDKDFKRKKKIRDSCFYEVYLPKPKYSGGSLFLSFNKISDGVTIHVHKGTELKDALTEVMMAEDEPPSASNIGEWLKLENGQSFFIIVQPKPNSVDTSFEFEYYTTGVENGWFQLYIENYGVPIVYSVVAAAGIVAFCIILLILNCIAKLLKCKSKRDKGQIKPKHGGTGHL